MIMADNNDIFLQRLILMDEDYDLCPPPADTKEDVDSRLDDLLSDITIQHIQTYPLLEKAADNVVNNLCAIRCEGFAMRHFGLPISDEELEAEYTKNGWLSPDGTAIHRIGRLAGTYGLNVSMRFECTLADIQEALEAGYVVIAAIDATELNSDAFSREVTDYVKGKKPNHVVIVDSVLGEGVVIRDSATPQQLDTIQMDVFLDAWDDSSKCLICISDLDEYIPHPLDLSDVELSAEFDELREAIAENAHEVWAAARQAEGWKYGATRNDELKQHPDMLPYNRLPESEKEYDRLMAMNTIKLLKKLGWEILKRK